MHAQLIRTLKENRASTDDLRIVNKILEMPLLGLIFSDQPRITFMAYSGSVNYKYLIGE